MPFPFAPPASPFPLSPDDQRMALIQALMQFGGQAMAGAGPSRAPVSIGSAIGPAAASAVQGYQGAVNNAVQQKIAAVDYKKKEADLATTEARNKALAAMDAPPGGTEVASTDPTAGFPLGTGAPAAPRSQFPLGMTPAQLERITPGFLGQYALQNMRTGEWEPIKDDKGNVIGQQNVKTGETKYLPANLSDQWEPVKENGIPGQRNKRTGEFKALDPTLSRVTLNPTIMQPFESSFDREYGTGLGKEAVKVHETADAARNKLTKLEQLDGLLQNFETGKLAPAQSTVAAWADALGMDDATLAKFGLDKNMAVNGQAIQAITNALTVSMIGPGGFPANNFSEADRKFVQQTMPQLANMPGANKIISQALRKASERELQKEEMWMQARTEKRGYADFLKDWNAYVKKTPLFPKVMNAGEMAQLPSGTVFTAPDGSVRIKP